MLDTPVADPANGGARLGPPRLPRRPVHLASAEQVDVEVVDGLSAFRAGADHHSIAFAQPLLARNFGRHQQQPAQHRFIRRLRFGQRCQVLFRDHENMRGRFRLDVVEGEYEVVLANLLSRDRAGGDFAEDAVRVQVSPLCCPPGRGC